MNMNFVCVYRSGKVYTPEYVLRLAESIAANYPEDHTFTILTDVPEDVPFTDIEHQDPRAVRLDHSWPSYWPKIELFRPGLFPPRWPVVYFDLDTIPRKSLSFLDTLIFGSGSLYMLRDWLAPTHCNSSVMAWLAGDFNHIYHRFVTNADGFMREYKRYPEKWGDQSFIFDSAGVIPFRLQDRYPEKFVSFKANTTAEKCAASVVCFHGRPRPHEVHWAATAPFGER